MFRAPIKSASPSFRHAPQSGQSSSCRSGTAGKDAASRSRPEPRPDTTRGCRRPDPSGAGARPRGYPQAAGLPMHRPRRDSSLHPGMVRPSLVDRDHVPGDAPTSRRGNPAAVVRARHRADDAGTVGPVLPYRSVGRRAKVAAVLHPRPATWYVKDELTFSDAIATVRRALCDLSTSQKSPDTAEIPIALLQRLTQALC
jgi:hypothetical protein